MSEVFEVAIGRTRVGWGARVSLDPAAAAAPREPVDEVPRIARTLALAHVMQRMIDTGEVKDQAELARLLGFTRARVTQMLDLTLLAPDIQEAILVGGGHQVEAHTIRRLTTLTWTDQRTSWQSRRVGTSGTSFTCREARASRVRAANDVREHGHRDHIPSR